MMWVEFFMLSGIIFWLWQAWRVWRFCNAHYNRIKWAVWGYKRPSHRSRYR